MFVCLRRNDGNAIYVNPLSVSYLEALPDEFTAIYFTNAKAEKFQKVIVSDAIERVVKALESAMIKRG